MLCGQPSLLQRLLLFTVARLPLVTEPALSSQPGLCHSWNGLFLPVPSLLPEAFPLQSPFWLCHIEVCCWYLFSYSWPVSCRHSLVVLTRVSSLVSFSRLPFIPGTLASTTTQSVWRWPPHLCSSNHVLPVMSGLASDLVPLCCSAWRPRVTQPLATVPLFSWDSFWVTVLIVLELAL